MFAIYDQYAVQFRDTLANLYKVLPIEQTNEIQANINTSFDEQMDKNLVFKRNPKQSKYSQEALLAYKKVAHIKYEEVVHHVDQIMSRNVHIAHESTTIAEVLKLFELYNINQVPILKDHDKAGTVGAMLSKDDILTHLVIHANQAEEVLRSPVSTMIIRFVLATDPISDIRRVAKVLSDFRLNALPVIDEHHKLVGVVAKSDIIRTVSHEPHFQMWS
jgi:CBS domain-containing protein